MQGLYHSVTFLLSPLIPLWLEKRRKQGKEDPQRLKERLGLPSRPRPVGKLLWIHAASVGESNAALPLIEQLLQRYPALHVLLTTGTVTSARLMAERLPARAIHQFVPVDTPRAVHRFMAYWKPDVALFVDSELWPNLIHGGHQQGVVMGLLNARMSERSFRAWRRVWWFIGGMLTSFRFCFAQSEEDAIRLSALGMRHIDAIGNLKYDVPPLPCATQELEKLRKMMAGRQVWVAASTHPGEEEQVASVHRRLKQEFPDMLTVIVPRHPHRAPDIIQALGGLCVKRRSSGEPITPDTDIYLADTMGELGLFYRVAPFAFIGGSLVPHGGQNPIEALKLGCVPLIGPSHENFRGVVDAMLQAGACLAVADEDALVSSLTALWRDEQKRQRMVERGQEMLARNGGIITVIVDTLRGIIADD